MNHFDMVDFHLFIQIAEANSLRQGANQACLSAPAASARIANLEARTGTQLLKRSSKGVTLTIAGRAFLHHARQILDQIEKLNVDLQEYARSVKGNLRVASNPTAVTEYLPDILRVYLQRRPEVRLDLREMKSNDAVRAVAAGVSDIGIIMGSSHSDDLEFIPFRQIGLAVVAPLEHPLARRESVTFAELLDYEFIDFPESSPTYAPLHRAADRLGVRVKTWARASSFDTLCGLVKAGIGIGVAPEPSARRAMQSQALAVIPISDEGAQVYARICARRFKALPAFARDFVEVLAAAEAPKA